MSNRRSVFDIVASLLEALEGGPCNKTNMLSRANLSSRSSTRYVSLLLRFELAKREDSNHFRITEKGHVFLEEYKKLRKFIGG